jgi:energy-coupling factor transporter ATP-binding protein EcfA2
MSVNGSEIPIRIADLQKAFGEQKVLKGISLQVKRSETVAVLGRSGGGKSVLLKLIVGLQTPDGGSIQVAGQEITKLDENQLNGVRKRVGFLFQHAALYDSLTVEDNVAFPLSRHTKISKEARKNRVHELLADVGMDRDSQKMPSEISGGMQKNRFGLVVVAAYTDMKGDTQQARLLSEARAMVVRDYLVKNFKLDDTRIKTIGLGKSDKVADGGSVEILVYPEGTPAAKIRNSAPPSQAHYQSRN